MVVPTPKIELEETAAAPAKLLSSRAYELTKCVLAGGARFELDAGSTRVMRLIFGAETDCVVTQAAFSVHFGPTRQRYPNTYYRRVGPRIVSELLTRAHVQYVTRPMVIGLPAGDVPGFATTRPWSYAPTTVWIVPSPTAIRLIVRRSLTEWRLPYVGAIPTHGALALVELRGPNA